jgi:hypothetical protein
MGTSFLTVLPLALGGAISPMILLLQLATLASRWHPVARSLVVLMANAVVVTVITVVVVVTDHRTAVGGTPPGTSEVVGAWIRVILALLLLATAVRLALQTHTDTTEPPAENVDATPQPVRPTRYFLLGVAAMVSNATTIVLLIPAMHDVAIAGLAGSEEIVLYLLVAAIVLLPSYLPLVALGAMGRRGPAVLAHLSEWLRVHNRDVGIAVSLGFAIYLGWTGFAALA